MRRKNRKWVAIGAGLYLLVMWSAWHWSVNQIPTDGSIIDRRQRLAVERLHQEKALAVFEKPRQQTPLRDTGEARLNAAGPAFVAARYDQNHVVFIVATDTESRFPNSPLSRFSARPTGIPAAAHTSAPLAGLHELYEPDSHSLHFFPAIMQNTLAEDQWILSAGANSTIPVSIERPVIAPTGCSLGLGFLASVPANSQSALGAIARDYFLIRRVPVEPVNPPVSSHIGDIAGWKASAAAEKQIEQQLTARMQQELAAMDAHLRANANTPEASANDYSLANPNPSFKEWIHADKALARGNGVLDFDIHAYRLTPDAQPRLLVRARWKLANTPAFLMAAWFRQEAPDSTPQLLSADASLSFSMRRGEAAASLGDTLDFVTVLNEFDADHDGWAELLIHSYDRSSATITPYLYTDLGLVRLKESLHRDLRSPESCLDP